MTKCTRMNGTGVRWPEGFSEKNAEESCPEKHEGYGHEGGNGAGPLCLLGGILLGMQILYIRQHLAKTIFSVRHVFCHFVAMLVIFDAHIGIIHRKTGFFMLCKIGLTLSYQKM